MDAQKFKLSKLERVSLKLRRGGGRNKLCCTRLLAFPAGEQLNLGSVAKGFAQRLAKSDVVFLTFLKIGTNLAVFGETAAAPSCEPA